jgi:hypothetical protein
MIRHLLKVLRLLLIVLLGVDLFLIMMVVQQWYAGGLHGVEAWIIHTHLSFGRSFDQPIDQTTIRESYRDFAMLIGTLCTATALVLLSERRIAKKVEIDRNLRTSS